MAVSSFIQAQDDSPELAEPHYNAANTHYRLEDYEQSQQEIEQALVNEKEQETLDQNSFYNLGNTFFQTERYEAAIEAYQRGVALES